MEVMRLELIPAACKATILPLNYTPKNNNDIKLIYP